MAKIEAKGQTILTPIMVESPQTLSVMQQNNVILSKPFSLTQSYSTVSHKKNIC